MNCPIGKPLDDCPCEYSKQGLCDYPYRNDLPPEPWTEIARLLAEGEAEDGLQAA